MTRSIVEQAHDMYDAVPYEVPVADQSLYCLLDDAARLYPDRVALDYFGATTTYAQVRDQVHKAARVLHEAGVGIAFCAKPAVREQVSVQLNTPDLSLAIAPLGLA